MWYLAETLFAEPPDLERAEVQCEACNVVFRAASAVEAYRRAVSWGQAYAAEPPTALSLLGVSHLTTVGEELDDGTEICGRFFQVPAVSGLVPPPEQLKAIQWERSRDTPLGELLVAEQVAQLRRVWGKDAGQKTPADRPRD